MMRIRINCPDSHLSREERINRIYDEFDKWVSSDAFLELVELYGGKMPTSDSVEAKIKYLKSDFIDKWDYRKHQKEAQTKEGEAARWLLENDEFAAKNAERIIDAALSLGLGDIDKTTMDSIDYILPLGGAKMSNLRRSQLGKRTYDLFNDKKIEIVALTGFRPLASSEMEGFIDTYAPEAKTEYDAMCVALQNAFDGKLSEVERVDNANENLSFAISKDDNSVCYVIAAPSTNELRRANSADCFKFFFDKFDVPKHANLVNCTSEIYCPYQQVRALVYAIEYDVNFDTIGFAYNLGVPDSQVMPNKGYSKPVQYLQEIKATIDAMYDFVMKY